MREDGLRSPYITQIPELNDPTRSRSDAQPKIRAPSRDEPDWHNPDITSTLDFDFATIPSFDDVGDPVTDPDDLPNDGAALAYKSFGYFRQRYFQRRNIPWQIEVAQICMSWLEEARENSERVFGCLTVPPGGGKTTTVTHDLPAWGHARDRNLRVGLGAKSRPQSEKYVMRLRNTYDKNLLLNIEFGRFRPEEPEMWRQNEFIIDGMTGHPPSLDYKLSLAGFDANDPRVKKALKDPFNGIHQILAGLETVWMAGEKEPSVKALSYEMGFLGGRYDLNIWDDLVDRSNSKSPDLRDGLAEWWDAEAVTRCEPGGIVALVGTRFGKYDLFRRNRELTFTEEEAEEQLIATAWSGLTEEQLEELREDLEKELVDDHGKPYAELVTPTGDGLATTRRVYRYVTFPAHNEDVCPAPASLKAADHTDCLLDNKRFRWHDLMRAKAADSRKYALTYQQQDEADTGNLVEEVWLKGGVDSAGILAPGCYNYERKLLEVPKHLLDRRHDLYSIATVDPSAQNWWSIQWWLYDRKNDKDYLLDLLRARIMAGAFLDFNEADHIYRGIAQVWQVRSLEMGLPISLWIVESNAAQRYLYQYRWVTDWMRSHQTHISPHSTGANKADPEFGVETLGPRYQLGLVDLPYHQGHLRTRVVVNEFKQELLDYPDGATSDMVMGHWFHHFKRYKLPTNLAVSHAQARIAHPYADTMPEVTRGRLIESRPTTPLQAPRRQQRGIWRPVG